MKRVIALAGLVYFIGALAGAAAVRMAEEPLVLPTEQVGPPDPNPMFFTHEAYQGAQKRVYPYALQDDLLHTREDKSYKALTLENEFIKIQALPELGGRLFTALDKTNNYDFFYRQHVIKPALIGMLGAWISGGIEWCVFHHHRNTTFMPVDYTLVENPDGGKTIWIGETERRQRMRWLIGLTVRPGRSYFEATVKLFNRTAQAHSILYWANAAVSANPDYQVIFPPSVRAATFHAKNDFTPWPIGAGLYSGYNYDGIDVSWWKNSPVHNSFFAWDRKEDFMGGYDHGKRAGVAHVADHNVVCGAKLWEWGTGSAGRMWDKILTDTDGPYAELMTGAWSDNQPDYSWIKPGEVKVFKQYWYPIRELGGIKNANLEAAVNLELKDGKALVAFNTTRVHAGAKARLFIGKKALLDETIDIAPDKPFRKEVAVPKGTKETALKAMLLGADGRALVFYQPKPIEPLKELPKKVEKPPKPEEIKNQEELYLTGLRVQQIHNPIIDPLDYFEEGLRRDPGDTRCNIAVGTIDNKKFMFKEAEAALRKALERLAADYTRPVSGEAWYQLGLSLRGQGKADEAADAFNRAAWDAAFHSAAMVQLAELSCVRGQLPKAFQQIGQALETNALDTRALGLKAAILRQMNKPKEAAVFARAALRIDPLDFLALNELAAADKENAPAVLAGLQKKMRGEVQSYLELACDYISCGMWDEALGVLRRPLEDHVSFAESYPTLHYLMGYAKAMKKDTAGAAECWKAAAQAPPDACFPFRAEELVALEAALKLNPKDARAWYYAGNLLYDLQPQRAQEYWENSRAINGNLSLVHRNLGWAYRRLNGDIPKATASYERAAALNPKDPRLLMELDVLYELGNAAPERRLALLEKDPAVTRRRNESFLRELEVRVLVGQYDRAIADLAANRFHVREGGGEIHDVYMDAHLLKGLADLKAGEAQSALDHFRKAGEYPENLSVGRPKSDPRAAQVAYCAGRALEALGEKAKAGTEYETAARPVRGEDRPEARYYQAASLDKLGKKDEARKTFEELAAQGRRQLAEKDAADYFAKFGEQQTREARLAQAQYVLGLGLMGLGEKDQAREAMGQAVKLNLSHVWAKAMMKELE